MTWPAVFDGVGALVVNCGLDPDKLADRIPGLTWISYKVGGSDVADDTETRHCIARWRTRGLKTGPWTYCSGPPEDDAGRIADSLRRFGPYDFCVYDVEAEYKSDEGGHFEWAKQLTDDHLNQTTDGFSGQKVPAAVTSYGGYKTSIDFASFAQAGWPILPQAYDSFKPIDALTYQEVYPREAIHVMGRSLQVLPGEAVYRPESIDG